MADRTGRDVWLVLPDPLSTRIFFDCGIVAGLRERLGDRLRLVWLQPAEQTEAWRARAEAGAGIEREELVPARTGAREALARRLDAALDERIGFYPIALRHSLRHGFHRERMQKGHQNWFLDPARKGPLPRTRGVDRAMMRWHFGPRRHVPSRLSARMAGECGALVAANVQMQVVVPLLLAAQRLGLPVAGYVASWDHTVGKGVVPPGLDRYLVQNDVMRGDLVRYHEIDAARIEVTGWPQTDVFHRRRPRSDYELLLTGYGLDPGRPTVLVMGNTPTNAPYEPRLVERLVDWFDPARIQLLLRPHPRDSRWRERFAAAVDRPGAHVLEPSYTDIEVLATLLQHGDCVVSNAGTILLDSLVNDRPTVCVLWDEGAPPGESWALKNVGGEHYRALVESSAFYRARDFGELTAAIERGLAHPAELREERTRVAHAVVGEIDGRAAERVVDAMMAVVG